jgi:D-psicose/D-tagatose/L-ribulose 3-epimerase
MKFGVNALLWTLQWTDKHLSLVDKCQRMGFDFIEIPLFELSFDAAKVARALNAAGLEGVGCIAINQSQDITSTDPGVRAAGVDFLKRCVDKVHEWKGTTLGGAISTAWYKNVGRPANEDDWKWSSECLKEVAQYAGPAGVKLGVEPINRYETFFITTLEQAAQLVGMIDEPNVKILADLFHMNMEEKNLHDALVQHKGLIGHLHFAENDRGLLGSGHTDWAGVFQGLAEIGFTETGAIETFVLDVPELAAATNIWRRLIPSADVMASAGLAFLKREAARYGLC